MSTAPINSSKLFTLPSGGIIRSASITPYDPNNGFCICEEERKGFPDTSVITINAHLVGGKAEMDDIHPFQTGIREFCEEVPFILPGFSLEQTVEILRDEFEPCTKRFKDVLVSKQKNLYHRFYIVNISEMMNDEVKSELYKTINHWRKTEKSSLTKLVWWRRGLDLPAPPSPLFENLLRNMPNESSCSRKI